MIGAILGDMIGSPYEFDLGNKSKEFPLFSRKSVFTDDTVMTIAVAKAFMEAGSDATDEEIHLLLKRSMRELGKAFPYAGYGGMFRCWLEDEQMDAYGSYGNGSAMRVSSVAWLYNELSDVRHAAKLSACL